MELPGLESVEGGSSSAGVGTKGLKVEPIADMEFWHVDTLGDTIEGVTGGTKNGAAVLGRLGRAIGGVEDQRIDDRMIEEQTVERTVDTIIDVVEKLPLGLSLALRFRVVDLKWGVVVCNSGLGRFDWRLVPQLQLLGIANIAWIIDSALRRDVAGKGVARSSEIATWFGDHLNVRLEEFVDNGADRVCDGRKRGDRVISARPATAQIENTHWKVEFKLCKAEEAVCIANGLDKGIGASATAADMEADTDHRETQLLGSSEQEWAVTKRSTELGRELAHRVGIVSDNTQHERRVWPMFSKLVELKLVVKGDEANALFSGESHVVDALAWISKDDIGARIDGFAERKNVHDLGRACTVKGTTEGEDGLEDGTRGVAFDGIERASTRQLRLELDVFFGNPTQIDNEEGVAEASICALHILLGDDLFDERTILNSAGHEPRTKFGGQRSEHSGEKLFLSGNWICNMAL